MEENNKEEKNPVEEANPTSTKENENDTHKADATVDGCSSEKQESIPREEWWVEKHSIYDYLKEHPSVFIAGFSCIIAIASFILKYVAYCDNARHLQNWGFPTDILSLTSSNFSFQLGITFLLIVLVLAIEMSLFFSINSFLQDNLYWRYLRKAWRIREKELRNRMVQLKKDIKQIKRIKKKTSNKKALLEIAERENVNATRQKTINEMHGILLNVKIRDKEFINQAAKVFIIALLVVAFSYLVLFSYLRSLLDDRKIVHILTSLALLFFCMEGYLLFVRKNSPRIKQKDVENDFMNQKVDEVLKQYGNKSIEHISRPRIVEKGPSYFLTNGFCIALSTGLSFLLLAAFIAAIIPLPKFLYVPAQDAEIVSIDGINYYVVYKQGNSFYLDEAMIREDNLFVKANKQRYLNSDDVSIEKRHFNRIYKVENDSVLSTMETADQSIDQANGGDAPDE